MVFPDQTGTGAEPLWRAKAAALLKRLAPALSPRSLAAIRGPQPCRARSVGARSTTRSAISRSSRSIVDVNSRMRASWSRGDASDGALELDETGLEGVEDVLAGSRERAAGSSPGQ